MPVRLIDVPGLSPTRINAPSPSAAAANAPAQGLGELAEGIASISKPFAQISGQIQQTENARQISEARLRLSEARAKHQLDLDSIHDPDEHLRLTGEFLQKSREIVDRPEFSPAVRDKLALYFDEWATDTKSRTAANAATLSEKRARLALDNELNAALDAGNSDQAINLLDEAVNAGILLPEQRDAKVPEFRRQVDFRAISKQIEEEPLMGLEQLNDPDFRERYPSLQDDDVNRLRRFANQSHNSASADLWNDTLNAAMDGTVLSAEQLSDMAELGMISAAERAAYARTWHSTAEPEFDAGLYDSAFSAVTQYDPANDPTGAGIASLRQQLATLPLPKAHLAELSKRLTDRTKPPGNSRSHRLTADFQKITDQAFDDGKFGDWFTYGDHDNDPRTMNRKIITWESYTAAVATRRTFLDAWNAYLTSAPPDLDPKSAKETYDTLFQSMVIERDDLELGPATPEIPNAIDYNEAVDSLLPPLSGPGAIETGTETSSLGTFGGRPIQPAGSYYSNAKASVFGGPNDPVDNGLSAFGGATGAGGKQGVAIPHEILKATFPGKDKRWFAENVRVHVVTPSGAQATLPVVDLGTAEWVWQKNGRATLDLTEEAARQLGGTVTYKDGKIAGVHGISELSFALTSTETPEPATGKDWPAFWQDWFKAHKPTDASQINSTLSSLLEAHALANYSQR